jgi:hypothetical protein
LRSRVGSMHWRAALVAAAVSAVLSSCGGGPGGGTLDHTAPRFEGLLSARTCVPGPGDRPTSFTLRWKAAVDDTTDQQEISYAIYRSSKRGDFDFGRPTYTAVPGATSFQTPRLSAAKTWFFVVRARDRAGNIDANRVEREGQNICR